MIILSRHDSQNNKLGEGVRATYRQVGPTCPSSCALLSTGVCYAQYGPTGIHSKRSEWDKSDGQRVYDYLLKLPKRKKVRHHVSGDFFVNDAPDWDYIESVILGHSAREDLKGWSYTHGWRQLEAKYMNIAKSLCVNASCDNEEEAVEAVAAGWPTVMVGDEDFGADGKLRRLSDGTKLVVCPSQTHDIPCSDCMLCFRKQRDCVVVFRAHGHGKKYLEEVRNGSSGDEREAVPAVDSYR
jgi:hypothetical protein